MPTVSEQKLGLLGFDKRSEERSFPPWEMVLRLTQPSGLRAVKEISCVLQLRLGYNLASSPLALLPRFGTSSARTAPSFESKYVGVAWNRQTEKWRATITKQGKFSHLGYFSIEEEAARAYDLEAGDLRRPVNFPGPGQVAAQKQGSHGIVSIYRGVSWNIRRNSWEVRIVKDKKKVALGYFKSEEEAATQYDKAATELGLPVNFPSGGQVKAVKRGTSRYEGVHWDAESNLWEAFGGGGQRQRSLQPRSLRFRGRSRNGRKRPKIWYWRACKAALGSDVIIPAQPNAISFCEPF